MRAYEKSRLSARQAVTPEGYLICYDVPLARLGVMRYAPQELPLEPGPDGLITVDRQSADLFNDITVSSLEGKPFTIGHPREMVGPGNWSTVSHGILHNVGQRPGLEADILYGDLLLTTAQAIARVRDEGVREVSMGYDADYEKVGRGQYLQRNIIGNHLALVPAGRCGPRCAIGDGKPMTIYAQIQAALATGDTAEAARLAAEGATLDAAKESETETETEDAAPADKSDEDEDEDEDKPKKKPAKTDDSAAMLAKLVKTVDGLSRTVRTLTKAAKAPAPAGAPLATAGAVAPAPPAKLTAIRAGIEILTPGARQPTLDSATPTMDCACNAQRAALSTAFAAPASRVLITNLLGGRAPDFAAMSAETVDTLFNSAVQIRTMANNHHMAQAQKFNAFDHKPAASVSQAYADYWAKAPGPTLPTAQN